jgi:hypothetical protein
MILANVRGLRRVVEGLRWRPPPSAWSGYEDELPYSAAARARKEAFVRRASASRTWRLAWDLGCNTGTFARIAAEHSRHVVAVDADPAAVERLYQGLKAQGETRVLPLVWDLADPSPALGWRGLERKTLDQRGRPQLTLCLALLHHAVLGRNLPLAQVVDWLAGLTDHLLVEFVTRQDPMVQRLLRQSDESRPEYDLPVFERLLAERFEVLAREELPGGTRVLYHARARSGEGGRHE